MTLLRWFNLINLKNNLPKIPLLVLSIWIILLCLDLITTFSGFAEGYCEKNPLVNYFLNEPCNDKTAFQAKTIGLMKAVMVESFLNITPIYLSLKRVIMKIQTKQIKSQRVAYSLLAAMLIFLFGVICYYHIRGTLCNLNALKIMAIPEYLNCR